jgi:hypothetical protein
LLVDRVSCWNGGEIRLTDSMCAGLDCPVIDEVRRQGKRPSNVCCIITNVVLRTPALSARSYAGGFVAAKPFLAMVFS